MSRAFSESSHHRVAVPEPVLDRDSSLLARLAGALSAALALDDCVVETRDQSGAADDAPDPYVLRLPLMVDDRCVAKVTLRRSTAPFTDSDLSAARGIVALAAEGLSRPTANPHDVTALSASTGPALPALPDLIVDLVRAETGFDALVVPEPDSLAAGDRLQRVDAATLPPGHPASALLRRGDNPLWTVPLTVAGEAYGTLYVAGPDGADDDPVELHGLVPRVAGYIDRIQAAEQATRHAALQALLADATDILLAAHDLGTALEDLCRRAAGVLGDGISITILNHAGDGYAYVAAAHVDPVAADLIRRAASTHPGGAGLSAEARRQRRALIVKPLDESVVPPVRWPLLREAGVAGGISVPLRGAGGSAGNLVVYATREATILDQTTYQVATILGDRIGDVLTRHELQEAAEQQAANLESLLRSAAVVAQQGDLEATLDAIVVEIERIIPVDLVAIWKVDWESNRLRAQVAHSRGQRVPPELLELEVGQGVLSTVLETREPAYYPEAHRHPRSVYLRDIQEIAERQGESVLVAPLTAGDAVIGVLFVQRLGVDRFSADDFGLFQLFASQAAAALHQAMTLDLERRRRQEAEALAAVTATLARATSTAAILPVIAEATVSLAGCDRAWVVLCDPESGAPVQAGSYPEGLIETPADPAGLAAALQASLTGLREPCLLDRGSVVPAPLREAGLVGGLVAPLLAAGSCLGAIYVWKAGLDAEFPPGVMASVGSIASQAAAVIARLRADHSLAEQLRTTTVLRRAAEIALEIQTEPAVSAAMARLILEATGAARTRIWLLSQDERELVLSATAGSDLDEPTAGDGATVDLSTDTPLVRAWRSGQATWLRDVERRRADLDPSRAGGGDELATEVMLPVPSPDGVLGVVCLDYRSGGPAPDSGNTSLGEAVARQFGLAVSALRLRDRWRTLYRSSVEALAATVDARDPFTHMHSRNVAHYSRVIAEQMGLPLRQVEQIELAGLLHDIGKIGIADRILTKAGPLDPDERMVMMTHPVRGAQILASHEDLAGLVPIVRHHHERYDGFGYPDGLAGDDIPLGAAIVGVADAFDTMVSDRNYARRRPPAEALQELERNASSHFHPQVVAALQRAVLERPGIVRRPLFEAVGLSGPARMPAILPPGEVAQIRVLSRIARELGALTDLSTFIDRARQIVAAELGYPNVDLVLRDPATGEVALAGRAQSSICLRIAEIAIACRTIVNVADVSLFPDAPMVPTAVRSMMAVPLIAEDEVLGALAVGQARIGAFFAVDEELLTAAADQLAAAIRVAQLHDRVKRAARHDGLTDTLNHRAFYQELEATIAEHRESGRPASLILCDVDGLKQVNDQLGHLAGDHVLRALVARIRLVIRPQDVIARYGGDEFAIITSGTSRREAEAIGRRLRASLLATPLLADAPPILVTVGVAQIGEDGGDPASLVAQADARLYEARGRRSSRRS